MAKPAVSLSLAGWVGDDLTLLPGSRVASAPPPASRPRTSANRALASAAGPLQIGPLPPGWKLQYNGSTANGTDNYVLTLSKPSSGVFLFSRWPPPSKPEDIPSLVREQADRFVQAQIERVRLG